MLESNILYEQSRASSAFLPRPYPQKDTPLLIYGPPKSGKTSLALEYAKNAKNAKRIVFVDCADMRFCLEDTQKELLKAFLEKAFDLLVVDNYDISSPAFSLSSKPSLISSAESTLSRTTTLTLTLPNLSNIILVCASPICDKQGLSKYPTHHLAHHFAHHLAHLRQMRVLPLSFREFVSFSKAQKLESIFSTFLKGGNLPEMPFLTESKHTARNQEIIRLAYQKHARIFQEILDFQGQNFSAYSLLRKLKPSLKTSKDTIYAFIESLKSQQSIFLLPHTQNRSKPKLYLYNFALPYALSASPHFQHIFENMVFCELLLKYSNPFSEITQAESSTPKSPISYDEECDFLVNDIAYIVMPFPNDTLLKARLQKLTKKYKKVIFISIEHSEKQSEYEVQSFIDFALDDEVG